MAACGLLDGVSLGFEKAADVQTGGVLCAIPALLAFGLLKHSREKFAMSSGYYPMETIFLVLALMALARIRSVEQLRYEAPGEWGRLLGLDRIPEVKTLREKVGQICSDGQRVRDWSRCLAKEWLQGTDAQTVGALYVDGHIRVYHGKLTQLPRRYVSREKLCLRGTTDYWVNAMDGQPFFVVSQPVDPGLIAVIRDSIVPRLLQDVPNQPSPEELTRGGLVRFTLIFDREGYSPDFFQELKALHIAVISYHKFPGEDWPEDEFTPRTVELTNGETVEMFLAERGVQLSNKLWIREIRKRDESGEESSVLSTDPGRPAEQIAARMFGRWSQENFFKYMNQHYSLDRLIEHGTQKLPETTQVINPAHRALESQIRKTRGQLTRQTATLGALHLPVTAETGETERLTQKQAEVLATVQGTENTLKELKEKRKETPKRLEMRQLAAAEQFQELKTDRKHFIDTIKLLSYRAETALAHLAREAMESRGQEDARAVVRAIMESTIDLDPDIEKKTLTIRLHHPATHAHGRTWQRICEELTATETVFPTTELTMKFKMVSPVAAPETQSMEKTDLPSPLPPPAKAGSS